MKKTAYKRSWRDFLEWISLGAAICVIILGGCASSPSGMRSELRALDAATNSVTQVARVVAPALPEPWAGLVTVSAGVVVSGLVLLQRHLRQRVQSLEAGHEELRATLPSSSGTAGQSQTLGSPPAPSGR